jgi:DUF4097 and DUF4098 domain-containing protein YvlB
MTRTQDRAVALVVGGVLALLFTVCAGMSLAGWSVGTVHRSEHHVLRGDVKEVRIDGSSGDVTLVPTTGRDVVVDSRAEGTLWLPKMETRIEGDHVSVRGDCHVVVFGKCGATFVVRVPAGVAVRAKTSSGDVRASGLSGPVNLQVSSGDIDLDALSGGTTAHVSSGDITARRLGGPLVLETSSGDVTALELLGQIVDAHASSGDVDVDVATVPRRVSASSSSGDVTIAVPRGRHEAYDTVITTSSGDRTEGVNSDPTAGRSLRAVTSSGDVAIRYREER